MATKILCSQKHRNPNSRRRKCIPPTVNTNLVMGQVKILKRGETLSAFQNKQNIDGADSKTNDVGHEPELVQKQIGTFQGLVYAGACCLDSPPPCCVPIPCFLRMT